MLCIGGGAGGPLRAAGALQREQSPLQDAVEKLRGFGWRVSCFYTDFPHAGKICPSCWRFSPPLTLLSYWQVGYLSLASELIHPCFEG